MTAASLRTTPLYDEHLELGARMVDFGGWNMPLHYGSQLDEHRAVRRACGMFDVSHMLAIDLHGPRTPELLSYVLANNVGRLREHGRALYSCMLNERGGVLDDLIVYFLGDDDFRLVVNAGTADQDLAWLISQRDKLAPDVVIAARRDLSIIAVQGPLARSRVFEALPESKAAAQELAYFSAAQSADIMIARTGYTGEDGFEVVLPAGRARALWRRLRELEVPPVGLGARDTLRLEAGMNLYGQDMDESTTPLETGLAWTVDLKSPRDFIGKQALLDARPVQHAIGLVLLDKGVMRSHQAVMTASGEGSITSGGFGPTLERSIALARVPLNVSPGAEVGVDVRSKKLRALTVKPPFVRNGKVLITA